jgi:hypothetical protein
LKAAEPVTFWIASEFAQRTRKVGSVSRCAINLLDVSIYCADSRAGELVLLDGSTGKASDGHDWNNLLTRWGLLEYDTVISRYMRAIAWLVCVASIVVAFWSARQLPRGQPFESSEP